MSDPSERPDVPAGEAPPNEPVDSPKPTPPHESVDSKTDGESAAKATTQVRPTRSPWLWLLAGVLAAILVPIGVQSVLRTAIETTEEQRELSDQTDPNEEDSQRLDEIKAEQAESRLRSTMINAGLIMGVVFGLFAGFIHHRLLMGLVGALVGVGVAFALTPFVTESILSFEADAVVGQDDIMAMVIHSLQWIVFGVAAAAAILVGSLRVSKGAQALGLMVLAAILGGVIYVVGGTAIDPAKSVVNAEPITGIARYLWTSLPPILAGFFLARTQ